MPISEIWSIPEERIRAFFSGQDDVIEAGENGFSCGLCHILITPLPQRCVGGLSFPQTKVVFRGPEPDITDIHQRFILQFISAGG